MATFVLIRHKVRDFAAWKRAFDAHAPQQAAAGLTVQQVLTNADNPNEVVILLAAQDRARAEAFASSPDLGEAMQKAGVLEKPDVSFLNG